MAPEEVLLPVWSSRGGARPQPRVGGEYCGQSELIINRLFYYLTFKDLSFGGCVLRYLNGDL